MKRFLSLSIPALIIALSLLIVPASKGDDILETFNGGVQNLTLMQNSALLSGIGVYETAAGLDLAYGGGAGGGEPLPQGEGAGGQTEGGAHLFAGADR
ncbi:MAG: hypothetical protein H8E46_00515 [FCB group bacterium]|nr:hypothetical protein [FCB group bacterium]